MPSLVVQNGPDAGKRFAWVGPNATIGRHGDCEVSLTDEGRISRHHARIIQQGDTFFLVDLGSRNGTFVNAERIHAYPLRDGDRVSVCDVGLVFKREVPAAARAGQPGRDPTRQTDDISNLGVFLVEDEADSSTGTCISKMDLTSGSDDGAGASANLQPRFNALVEITRSLGNALALDEVLPQVLNSLFKIFPQADRGFIVLQEPDGELVPRWKRVRVPVEGDAVRISRTIIQTVLASKEAILSADATRDERLQTSRSIAALQIRSVMCSPLLDSEGDSLGVIQLDTLDQNKLFREADLEVFGGVAVQAGIAIHNAQLHENALREKELRHDLELAHVVQKAFLPKQRPELPGYEFCDFYEPANQVGGDYFDYISLPDGRTAVVVGDVVGHGFSAAMLMANLAAEAKYCLASENHPAAALSKLNDRLGTMHTDRFVTLVLAVLDPRTHEVTLVNAGHMLPIWRRVQGTVEELAHETTGPPLGIVEGWTYEPTTITLSAGEVLFIYTDGINEAMNPAEQQFGKERLRRHVCDHRGPLQSMAETIIDDVRNFMGRGVQTDDICLVAIARTR